MNKLMALRYCLKIWFQAFLGHGVCNVIIIKKRHEAPHYWSFEDLSLHIKSTVMLNITPIALASDVSWARLCLPEVIVGMKVIMVIINILSIVVLHSDLAKSGSIVATLSLFFGHHRIATLQAMICSEMFALDRASIDKILTRSRWIKAQMIMEKWSKAMKQRLSCIFK